MKILKELSIILGILFFSHIIIEVTRFPIPAPVLGMIVLLFALLTGLIKLGSIEKVSGFLLDNLTLLFIPGGVGLLTSIGLIKGQLLRGLAVVIITMAIGMGVTGITVQLLRKAKKEGVEKCNT